MVNFTFQLEIVTKKLARRDFIIELKERGSHIDALKIVANGVNAMKSKDRSTIVVTHYQRLLNYIVPDFVHVIVDGMIVKSGDKTLALELEEKGYEEVIKESKN